MKSLKEVIKSNILASNIYYLFKFGFGFLNYNSEFNKFKKLAINSRFSIKFEDRYPMLYEKTATTDFSTHYIYHLAWAARVLARTKPDCHIDISSSLYFCSIVSAFIPVKFYDYRPARLDLKGLISDRADLMNLLFADNSIKSLSCMHTIEHVGLGRYGDLLDPDGDLKAISELKRVLAIGGNLLFVVPIGKPRIIFNAHRIYSYDQIINYFFDFKLVEFTLIPEVIKEDKAGIIYNASKELADSENYGCGCFLFTKNSLG
jgi:SAM-dependent methyltransferase